MEIFRYYLDASPWSWPRLIHVCRKWRRLVFLHGQSLQLQLFCTHGTPVKKNLDCWHRALPIVVAYGGSPGLDPPTLEDENDIMAALNQPDRVHSISLTITSSLLEKLTTIERPFSKLEHLILLSGDEVQLTLPSAFRWGQHLRHLHSTRIVIPSLDCLHYSSIKDLQLQEVPNPWHFSPNELPDALFRMTKLRSLSLHFLPTSHHVAVSLPTCDRIVLPALTRLKYQGTLQGIAEDLENLVARIDTRRIEEIEVTFTDNSESELVTDLSKLIGFIDWIKMPKYDRQAHILSSGDVISISLMQPEVPTRIKIQFCGLFGVQLDFSSLTRLFLGVKWLHVAGNAPLYTFRLLDEVKLPALHGLYIPQPGPRDAPLREAVVSFMTSRRLSGHPIAVQYERLSQMSELSRAGTKYAQCYRHCTLTCFQ